MVGGELDEIFGVDEVRRTAKAWGTRAHVFRRMGHMLMREPGEGAVADLIIRWIDDDVGPAVGSGAGVGAS